MTAPLLPMLRKLGSRHALDGADTAAILALPHTVRRFAPNKYIVREGDRAEYCCALLAGFAFRQKIVGDGGRQIVSYQMPGDIVDLPNSMLKIADHSVQALTRVDIACIPRQAITELAARHPNVAQAMWLDTLVDASISREWLANIGRRDARGRLAHLLCEFLVRSETAGIGSGPAYELPMTQEHLGDALGLTSVHVNRSLRLLEIDGLIDRTKRRMTVTDMRQLERAGDFDPGYLHLDLLAA